MAGSELQENIEAFDAMRSTLEEHHLHKYVVFHDGALIGAYDTFHAAAREAVRLFGSGPYLIRQVGAAGNMPMPASVAFRLHHASR